MRVMVVDDAAFMRLTMRRMLENAGYEIAGEATNGDEAVSKYSDLKPDIVTMDITMPGKDGIEATKIICANDPQAKILMVSAMGQASMVKEAILSGAKDFIVKPIDEERLLDAIGKIAG